MSSLITSLKESLAANPDDKAILGTCRDALEESGADVDAIKTALGYKVIFNDCALLVPVTFDLEKIIQKWQTRGRRPKKIYLTEDCVEICGIVFAGVGTVAYSPDTIKTEEEFQKALNKWEYGHSTDSKDFLRHLIVDHGAIPITWEQF